MFGCAYIQALLEETVRQVTVAALDIDVAEFSLQFHNVFSPWTFVIVESTFMVFTFLISPLLTASLFQREVRFFADDRGARYHCD